MHWTLCWASIHPRMISSCLFSLFLLLLTPDYPPLLLFCLFKQYILIYICWLNSVQSPKSVRVSLFFYVTISTIVCHYHQLHRLGENLYQYQTVWHALLLEEYKERISNPYSVVVFCSFLLSILSYNINNTLISTIDDLMLLYRKWTMSSDVSNAFLRFFLRLVQESSISVRSPLSF